MQLREFVDAMTADEPPLAHGVDDIIAAGRRAERRRRAGFASAGAAGLVAVAVGAAFALPSFGAQPAPTAEPATVVPKAFNFTFQGYDAGPFHVQDPITVSGAYEMAPVYLDGRFTNDKSISADETPDSDAQTKARINAWLTVYRPGAFDPSGIKGGQARTVAGRTAVQATLPADLEPDKPPAPGNKMLAWEYADNAWAVVTSISNSRDEPSFADLGALVPGLKPGPAKPAMLPFTVGHVPDGYEPVQVGSRALPGLGGINLARDGDYGGVTYARPVPATTGLTAPYEQGIAGPLPGSFSIFVQPSRNGNQQAVPGRTECYKYAVCNVWSADGRTLVQVTAHDTGAELSTAELTKIVESIEVADVAEAATWKPAAEALP
jgi:hypothetical protein